MRVFLRFFYFGIVLICIMGAVFWIQFFPKEQKQIPQNQITSRQSKETVKVIRVIDGDTIEIEGGKIVRYIGIDTPETKHPVKGIECFGKEASNFNKNLVEKKYIRMQKDVSETDVYKRLLRYVWLIDSPTATQDGIFVNDYLVREGYAYASAFPPDVKYSEEFIRAGQEAREKKKGLWSICSNN